MTLPQRERRKGTTACQPEIAPEGYLLLAIRTGQAPPLISGSSP